MNITALFLEPGKRIATLLKLWWLRQKYWRKKSGETVRFRDLQARITDGPNFYMQYKDEFFRNIYWFKSERPDPVIIDGGSNIGMSIIKFKQLYPAAKITGFEPDPAIYKMLAQNLASNGINDVRLVNAGLSDEEGETSFVPDGQAGGQLAAAGSVRVKMDRLSKYLDQPVDFLKLNIEGAELEVLTEAASAGRLGNVRELVLEYHGWPGGRQVLGNILNLLDREGFRYLVHDFDEETCGSTKPPFRLQGDTTWFCLVYAKRADFI